METPMKRKCMRYIHICVFGNTLRFLNMNSPSPRCHIWGPPFRCLSGSGMAHFSCFSPSGARWRCLLLPFRPPLLFLGIVRFVFLPPPRPWGQREGSPPSYDSRANGLRCLLGTFPPPPGVSFEKITCLLGKYIRKFPMNPGSQSPKSSSIWDLQLVENKLPDGLNSSTLQPGKHRKVPFF